MSSECSHALDGGRKEPLSWSGKWEQRVAELDRGEVDAKQAKLWQEDAARVVV